MFDSIDIVNMETFIQLVKRGSRISGTEITNETPIGKNITIYAKWEAINYTLNINLDGGSLTNGYYSGNNGVTYGQEIDLGTPKKDGYLFEGWFKNNAEFDGKLVIDGNVNVTAKWINIDDLEKEYSLTLNLNGGTLYRIEYTSSGKINSNTWGSIGA
mgnify:CR=1 FL=1